MNPAAEILCEDARRTLRPPWMYGPTNHPLGYFVCNGEVALWLADEGLPREQTPEDVCRTVATWSFPLVLGTWTAAEIREWSGPPMAILHCETCRGTGTVQGDYPVCHVCEGEGWLRDKGRYRQLDHSVQIDGAYVGLVVSAGGPDECVEISRGEGWLDPVHFLAETWSAVVMPVRPEGDLGAPLVKGGGR